MSTGVRSRAKVHVNSDSVTAPLALLAGRPSTPVINVASGGFPGRTLQVESVWSILQGEARGSCCALPGDASDQSNFVCPSECFRVRSPPRIFRGGAVSVLHDHRLQKYMPALYCEYARRMFLMALKKFIITAFGESASVSARR